MSRRRTRNLPRTGFALTGVPLASALLAPALPAVAQDQDQPTGRLEEVVVSAQKRDESLQDVPLSITALGGARLDELHVSNFEDYVKFLPTVSFQTTAPGFSFVFMRGVASGENGNHSTSMPTVGVYLDEQPVTTIQGALDIHAYDIARVEALAGPQGTLYGASSQAGTLRVITNKPDPSGFEAGYDIEGNMLTGGDAGYVAEGFVNIPFGESAAVRLVGWYDKEPGYISNVPGTRTFPTSGGCIANYNPAPAGCVTVNDIAEKDYNDTETYGARAALKINLNDSWSITPTVMGQKFTSDGGFATDPKLGDLKRTHFYPDNYEDKWWQAALTVQGKISNFEIVYAGSYLNRDDVVNLDYSDYSYFYDVQYGSGANFYDADGIPLLDPSQYIQGTDGYERQSHEIRIASPTENRFRFVAGLFYQKQEHAIFQRYKINGLSPDLSVGNWPDTIWLTQQQREDEESAIFGEANFDITDKLTITGGFRYFETKNSLFGFFGFAEGYSSNYGEALCFSELEFRNAPCTNLDDSVKEDGTVPKVSLSYKIDEEKMVYVTYSRGFRPGGINRNATVPPYESDYLTNYELGWKTTWADNRVRFNGAIFYDEFEDIQFSFLPPSGAGLSVVKNAGDAEIKGVEGELAFAVTDSFTLSGGFSYIDAKLKDDYFEDEAATEPDAPAGTRLPVAPRFKGNVQARYEFPISEFKANVQAALVYNGKSWSDFLAADRELLGEQPDYTIVDLSAGIERNGVSVELYAANAFDERATLYTTAECATNVCGVNPYVVVNRPRTIGLKFARRF